MDEEKYAFEQTFSFNALHTKTFYFLQDKDTLARLMKWSMLGRISAQSFSFDHSFSPYSSERFALCFFRDPEVLSSLRKMEAGVWMPLDKPVVSVSVEPTPCTKMLQDEESEHYYVVGRKERGEFLFSLFKHLCLGGELCQYEDTIDPYISTTKQIYKDLISVQKDPETKKISVVSKVIKVCAFDESGRCFPGTQEEEQTFAYLIVDPYKRHVTLFCHFYGVGNFTV
ncbi:cilia- and flagella-associated protein 300 isoform X3 [Oreochromis niloticus]|uniref:cilia- and flagella-associated protein 300 isoform X3 n=1 Tax=Oreochromis niloticus TaxID=8128 RepID=UPI00039414E1|nr:cilia- and flagella-associated protein 300 isoform X3 [Oreochromis niloticus]CAI5690630.1 unnamed protein product [Mustela putorius furo]